MIFESNRQNHLQKSIRELSCQLLDSYEKYDSAKYLYDGAIACKKKLDVDLDSIDHQFDQISTSLI